jgi:hypothetical protein
LATRIPARLSAGEGRRFGLTVGTSFLALAGLLWWRGRIVGAAGFGAVGAGLVAGALIVPTYLGPVQAGWMGLAHAISRVTTPVFTGIMYFAALTPFGIVRRTVGRSPLHQSRASTTFWVNRVNRRSDLQRQF